jgi:general nucleoside transport system ATP-binding protein
VTIGAVACGRLGAAARRRLGLAAVPEERLGRGAVAELSLTENALLTGTDGAMVRRGFVRFGPLRDFARGVIEAFRVVSAGTEAAAGSLSGGNVQKFIIGREVGHAPRALVAAHPTWGVDVGAALAIHDALRDLAASGVGVLVVSEDLDELFALCDRIAVLHGGRLSAATEVAATSIEAVGLLMGGMGDAVPA